MKTRALIRFGLVPLAFLALVSNGTAVSAKAHSVQMHHGRPIVHVGANKSNNWSGYNQGFLEKGNKLFSSIAGTWTVPTATAHKARQAEYSATSIGIGGGCVDKGCLITDTTLIQDGTEQDIDSAGRAHYSAWWELIPAPAVNMTGCASDPNCTVAAGNKMSSSIAAIAPGVWKMSMRNQSRGWSWSMTIGYTSSEATAEWIEETPIVVDNSGKVTVGPMPNLSNAHFDLALTNGANAGLKATEEVQLVDFNNAVVATPSAPDPDADGFNDCTYAGSCGAPASS